MTEFQTDPGVLDRFARRLSDGGAALGEGPKPAVPDAGEMSAEIAQALAKLCSSTDGMVKGLSALGQAVADCTAAYTKSDNDAASMFTGLLG
jgi:hypothetical protein